MKALNYNGNPVSCDVIDRIASVIGAEKISKEHESTIITPKSQADVIAAVKAVMAADGAITTKAAKCHRDGEVCLDFSDMKDIEFIDTVNMTAKVQVGCKFSDLVKAVEEKGFTLAVRPAGRDVTVED